MKWQSQKEIDPLKINSLSVKSKTKYPFYGQATNNNGIISYISLTEQVLNNKYGKPTILIHSNNQNVVYLETPFYLKDGHGATSVLQSDYLNEKIALYLISCIKKVITKKFSYQEKATKVALKNTYIKLPINNKNEIDYKYMQERISDFEQEQISVLEQYLKVVNLENYKLTAGEFSALNKFTNNEINYKEFKIGDLFVSANGDFDIQQKHINNNGFYVVSSGKLNTGIIGKTDIKSKIFDENTITIDMFGNACFRSYKYKMVTHARVFSLKYISKKLKETEGIFFTSLFSKFGKVFSYSKMASFEKMKNFYLKLPIDKNNEIDYVFIDNFIKAQQKLAIKNVIDFKDRIIKKI